tara:strand:- start:682 stop:822 length:141 start_codon:yes stop_codon:yes gene_type:complete
MIYDTGHNKRTMGMEQVQTLEDDDTGIALELGPKMDFILRLLGILI